LKKSRETISRFIGSCEGYEEEKAFRKGRSIVQRKEYQRDWDRKNRSTLNPAAMAISKESLRREHELAVRILSSEKY
jgi:leucyl aminopeptidase